MKKQREHIGNVMVDAGLVYIGDPCYFWPDKAEGESVVEERVGDWAQLCKRLNQLPYPYHLDLDGLGIVVTSGFGDGIYPVWATIEDGTIMSVTIEFISEDEDDEQD